MAAICTMVFMISPHTSLVRVFVSDSGSVIARQMILPLIVIPLMVGWIRISGEKQEFLNSEFGVVLIVLSYTTCFLIVAWLAARSFTRIDKRRQKADEASAKLNQRMKLLSDISANLLAAEDPQKIVNKLCRNVMEFLNCHVFFNYVIEDGSDNLHLNAYEGITDEAAAKILLLDPGTAIGGCVARDASPIIAEDIQHTNDPRANIVRSFGVRVYASFPLLSHEQVIGTLSFGSKNRDHFTDDDISLIKTVADQVAIAMGRIRNEQHLRESEDRFKTIAESLPSLISITRLKDGKFMFVNEVYCNTLGYSHDELLNKKAIDVYAEPSDREKILNVIQKDGVLNYHQTRLRNSDGTRIWVLSSVRPIIFEGEQAYLGATVDIDEQKRQQTELERLNRNLNALGKSSQLMMHSTNEFDFLNDVCRIITQDCGYMMVWVGYARNNESKSVEPVAFYGLDKTYIDLMDISWADTERGRGPTGNAIRTKKPAVCQNMLTDPAFVPWRDEAIKRGYASSLVLPLLSEGDVLGVICIYSREPDSFNPDDVQLLSNLADDLSYGIVHLRLAESEKKAARIIKESEEKFRVLFESMNEGFALKEMLVDGHGAPYDWKFLSVNPAFEKQTGLKAENIIGKNARKILPKVEPTWIELYGRVALEGISLDFVNYSADLNAWLRVSAFPIKKGTFACMIENITSKVLAERELRNTKDYLENLINYANAPIVVWDPGAEIKLFNHAFEHLTGYDSEDVLGKKIDILFPAESMKESHKKIREAATKNWETIEIPILTKDKKIRTVLWNSANIYDPDDNSILSTIAQGNDITERKLAEREVRNAIEKLDLALNNANIGIWTWDFKNNRWEWDERISDMLGISQAPDKYSLDVLEQYIFEEDFPHIRRALERSRQECTSLDTFFRIKKNDDFRYIELKGMVTKDYEGNPLKMR